MMMFLSVLVFGGALFTAVWAIHDTLAPEWRRIEAALSGRYHVRPRPLATLVKAERRIAVKQWAASAPRAAIHWRAAA